MEEKDEELNGKIASFERELAEKDEELNGKSSFFEYELGLKDEEINEKLSEIVDVTGELARMASEKDFWMIKFKK